MNQLDHTEENTVHIDTLIDLDFDNSLTHSDAKIYADFTSNEFGELPQVEQVIWGEYVQKPQAQHIKLHFTFFFTFCIF